MKLVAVLFFLAILSLCEAFKPSVRTSIVQIMHIPSASSTRPCSIFLQRVAHNNNKQIAESRGKSNLYSLTDRMAPKMQFPPVLRVLVLVMSTLLMKAKVSVAAVKSNIKGWDLYGRVPFDDWLFTTERLIDPNLLKKSYVEAVLNEIPAAYANFQYRRVIGEIMRFVKWGPVLVACIYLLTLLFKNTGKVLAERRALWESVRGFDTPISAARKGQRHKGVAVKGGKILFDRDPGLKENRGADNSEDDNEEDDDAEDDEVPEKGAKSKRRRNKVDDSDSDDE